MRDDRELTQRQFADHLMCDQSLYSKCERGGHPIPPEVMIRLAQYYKTSIDYLVGLTGNMHPGK